MTTTPDPVRRTPPLEGVPVLRAEQSVMPVEQPMTLAPVPGRRVVGYEQYGELLVPVYEAPAPPYPAAPVEPRRGMDPIAQRLWAAGGAALLAGVGGWLLFNPATAICLVALAVIVVALRSPRGGDTYITNINKWWGSSSTRVK